MTLRPVGVPTTQGCVRLAGSANAWPWRLHDVSKEAYAAALLASKANEALAAAGETTRIKTDGYEALAQTADLLGRNQQAVA